MRMIAALLALLLTSPAFAQSDGCAQFDWPIGREKSLFDGKLRHLRSGEALKLSSSAAVTVVLKPIEDVQWARNPERAPKNPNSYGGVIEVDGVNPGHYQVTLSEEAWIDVIQNDDFAKAAAHSGKEGCDGVRKSVRFQLGQGPLIVQLSGAEKDSINLAIVPVE